MSSEPHQDPTDRDHEHVRAAFRAAEFHDEPPREVDAAILAAAHVAGRRRLHGYWPPLAMAATVVLALGLVLRLAIPTREPPGEAELRDRQAAPTALEAEPLAREPAGGRAEAAREQTAQPAAAPVADTAAPAARAVPQAPLEEAVVNSRAADAELGAASSAVEAMAAPPAACAARFGDDPEGWLTCIEALLDAGELAAARGELDEFAAAYPERDVPDTIASRLAP